MGYENGKIYKLVSDGLIYYGSTIQSLQERLKNHKKKSNRCSSKQIIEKENYQIILIELFPCNTKQELFNRERWYIENNECVNKAIPLQTRKEYRESHKVEIKLNALNKKKEIYQQQHEWYEKNKEKLLKKAKEYKNSNKEKIANYQKEYRESHKKTFTLHLPQSLTL